MSIRLTISVLYSPDISYMYFNLKGPRGGHLKEEARKSELQSRRRYDNGSTFQKNKIIQRKEKLLFWALQGPLRRRLPVASVRMRKGG